MKKEVFTNAVVDIIKDLDECGFRDIGDYKVNIDFNKIRVDYLHYIQDALELAVKDVDVDTANDIIDLSTSSEKVYDMSDIDDAMCGWTATQILDANDDGLDRDDDYIVINEDDKYFVSSTSYLDDYLIENYSDEINEYYELDVYNKAKQHVINNIDNYVVVEDANEVIRIK